MLPPPAYGAERGSILLEAGGGVIPSDGSIPPPPGAPPASSRRSRRSRRPHPTTTLPPPSPLRNSLTSPDATPLTPPPPITPVEEELSSVVEGSSTPTNRYVSPTDAAFHTSTVTAPSPPPDDEETPTGSRSASPVRSASPARVHLNAGTHSRNSSAAGIVVRLQPPPDSPMGPDPPSPGESDIHLRALTPIASQATSSSQQSRAPANVDETRPPPAYSPLDAYRYSEGVHVDLPAEVIAAALEGTSIPTSAIGSVSGNRSERHSRRDRRR